MTNKRSKSKKDSKNALANMGANMSAMLSGASPLADSQSDNAEGTKIRAIEMPQPPVPANLPVTNPAQDGPVQSAEYNGISETDTPAPAVVNIDIEKTQGNAIYSSLLELQNTLDNFQLDVKQEHFVR